jgi:hypothetical protein
MSSENLFDLALLGAVSIVLAVFLIGYVAIG